MSPTTVVQTTPHTFVVGRDGIVRCSACKVVRNRAGMMIPLSATCPVLSAVEFDLGCQYVSPVEAMLADMDLDLR